MGVLLTLILDQVSLEVRLSLLHHTLRPVLAQEVLRHQHMNVLVLPTHRQVVDTVLTLPQVMVHTAPTLRQVMINSVLTLL